MKKLLLTASAIFGLTASVAVAEDFENTSFETVVYADNLQFSLSGDNNDGVNAASAGITFMPYQLGTVNANLYAELEYGFLTDEFTVTGEYQMYRTFAFGEVYGAAAVNYVAHEDDLSDGEWAFSPYAGVTYGLTDNISAFTEVGYSWNMSQDWDQVGGYGEVGVDFAISENITLTPSVVKTFDTVDDSTQMNLTMAFQF
jgi:outer membrane receptor protein involved in Fe transport